MLKLTLNDYNEITATVQKYLDSCKAGDSKIMKDAFTETATINGNPIQTLFDGVDEAGTSEVTGRIDIVEAINDIAVARVVMENYFGADYIDFHTLKKLDNSWK